MFISILLWPKPFLNKMVTLRIKHFSYHINKVLRVSPKELITQIGLKQKNRTYVTSIPKGTIHNYPKSPKLHLND